ncbi:MAG: hypothetical protein JXR62_03645 [Bacilli bacterium]|nr:hypothetical protein [Bacilli bacterium]
MNPIVKRTFQQNEKVVLKLGIGLLIATIVLFLVMLLVLRQTNLNPQVFSSIVMVFILGSVGLFITSCIRVVMYFTKVKAQDKAATIGKSLLGILLSVISFFIQFLLIIVIALSNFS